MTAFNSAHHISGPAIVTFHSGSWYTEGDITVDVVQDEWDVNTSIFGTIDKRIKSLPVAVVSFQPSGMVTTGIVGKAFPYTLNSIGKSIFGAADLPLVIWTLAGEKFTFAKAGQISSPDLNLSAVGTAFSGNVQFLCIHKTNTDPTTANSFMKVEAAAFTEVSFDQTKVLSPGYTAAFGAAPFDAMESLNGFKVSLPMNVSRKSVDRFGVIDAYLTSLGPATCNFTPAGMTEANFQTLMAVEAACKLPGVSGSSGSTNLVITGTGLTVTLPNSGIVSSKLGFGTDKERCGEVMFHNRAVFTAGVPGSLLTIAVS
jgi:hypothetical protein